MLNISMDVPHTSTARDIQVSFITVQCMQINYACKLYLRTLLRFGEMVWDKEYEESALKQMIKRYI